MDDIGGTPSKPSRGPPCGIPPSGAHPVYHLVVVADVVVRGRCLAVSHANSSASLGGRLDFDTDVVTLTFVVNQTLKGPRFYRPR